MSSIRDRLRRLNRPHAAEAIAEPVDEAERLKELERIIAADAARAPQSVARTESVSRPPPRERAAESPAPPPRPAPPSSPSYARTQPPPRSASAAPAHDDDQGLRFVPLDELEPSDNRLRRRKADSGAPRRDTFEPLPERTTIGKDASFLSLVSSRRFDAWKQRQSGANDSGAPPAPREIEYAAEDAPNEPIAPLPRAPHRTPAASISSRTPPTPAISEVGRPAPTTPLGPAFAHARHAHALPSSLHRSASAAGQKRGAVHLAEALDGRWIAGAHGPCFAAVEHIETSSLFGAVPVGEPFDLPVSTWQLVSGEAVSALEDLVFLDLETTGTEPNTDLAFVIGLGRASRSGFEVEQIAVHHPGEEIAALGALVERLRDVQGIVTFNGQRFDMRFLRTRFARHQLDPSPLDLLHLDLYLLARKAWGRHQPRYRLIDLEQNVLGFGRVDDVPGAEAPRRYARYRQSGDIGVIVPVFEHNRHDIVAMFPLLGRIASQMASKR